MSFLFSDFGAQAVWLDEREIPNRYGDFIHDFNFSGGKESARLYISADSEYVVYVNGRFADCGQYDDYPDHKSFDVLDLGGFLAPGMNRLAIRAYHQGTGSCQYQPGRPLLVYALVWDGGKIASGSECLCRESRDYVSGPGVQLISSQLSYSFEYDGRKNDAWQLCGFRPGPEWNAPFVYTDALSKISFYERPVEKLKFHPVTPSRLVTQGLFLREEGKRSRGESMNTEYLSARSIGEIFSEPAAGFHGQLPPEKSMFLPSGKFVIRAENQRVYLILDMGGEEAGLFTLKVNAREGTVIDVAFGEHLNDLRVRSHVGGRNFSFSYVCCEGEQEFTHYLKRVAGRYLELHLHNTSSPVTLYSAGLIPARYPLEERGVFATPDYLLYRILSVSRRTLELCLHEHYEDCPWREQGLYAFDSRNQMLAGYYLFNNYAFARASLALLAEMPMKNGFLPLTAPTDTPFTIPYFSLVWVIALREYVLYSGDIEGARPLYIAAEKLMRTMERFIDNGLAATPQGAEFWNFYEWAPGLAGIIPAGIKITESRCFDAPLNAAFCLALESFVELGLWLNERENNPHWQGLLRTARAKFDERFWVSSEGLYASFTNPDDSPAAEMPRSDEPLYAELTQALALCAKIPSAEKRKTLLARLAKTGNNLVPCTVSSLIFKYDALLSESSEYASVVFDDIKAKWGHMLFSGATSFWETIKGADDFDGAGSLCHGWTAIPAYYFFAYILGIKPLKPGFAEYAVSPVRIAAEASGSVTTPRGIIESTVKDGVAWKP